MVLDPGSFTSTPAVANPKLAREVAPGPPTHASNTLMISADHSKTGNPLMVGGPQIGYFYPGLTYEIDMHAGDLQWRGATSAPFPGYLLIGRGEDFAHTLTSASGDIIDQYVEKLCDGSDTKYMYKGKCREMGTFDAGTLDGDPVTFKTTVHGPVVGYATVEGEKVAISSKRSSLRQGHRSTCSSTAGCRTARCTAPKSFIKAASLTPQTFNSFYIDNKNIAMYTAGLLPMRNKNVDPGLPTMGTGKYEWTRLPLDRAATRRASTPRTARSPTGTRPRRKGFAAADDEWGHNGSVERVDLLDKNLDRLATQERQVDARLGHLGDERGGDPGRARDRHRAAAQASCSRARRPRTRRRSRCST